MPGEEGKIRSQQLRLMWQFRIGRRAIGLMRDLPRVIPVAINSRPTDLVNPDQTHPIQNLYIYHIYFSCRRLCQNPSCSRFFPLRVLLNKQGLHRLRLRFTGKFRVKLRRQVKIDGTSLLPLSIAFKLSSTLDLKLVAHHSVLDLICSQFIHKIYQHIRLIHLVQLIYTFYYNCLDFAMLIHLIQFILNFYHNLSNLDLL